MRRLQRPHNRLPDSAPVGGAQNALSTPSFRLRQHVPDIAAKGAHWRLRTQAPHCEVVRWELPGTDTSQTHRRKGGVQRVVYAPRPRRALSLGLGMVGLPESSQGLPCEQTADGQSWACWVDVQSLLCCHLILGCRLYFLGAQVIWEGRAGFPAWAWEAASSVAPAARPGRPQGVVAAFAGPLAPR